MPGDNAEQEERSFDTMDPILAIIMRQEPVTREQAMCIPAFAGCVRFITETVAGLPVRLYRDTGGEVEEIHDDRRTALINDDTGDILNGWQFKQALSEDMLVEGGGYAYINRSRNTVESIHYVARRFVSFLPGTDPIFKRCRIMVNGAEYPDFNFIKATRSTKDGVQGTGILAENTLPLSVAYNTMKFENTNVKTGGNKRGYIKSENKLSEEALATLEARWTRFQKEDSLTAMVLNKGLDFTETSATPEQLQISQRKKDLRDDICGLFGVSAGVLNGDATEDEYTATIKIAVLPVLSSIEAALNQTLLLDAEKAELYFAFDTKELLRGSIEKRYQAYKDGILSNVLQIDEARYQENLPPLGLTFIKLGLQDVLYDPVKRTVFVPNTGASGSVDGIKYDAERAVDYIQDPETGQMNGSRPQGGDNGTSSDEKQKKIASVNINFDSDTVLPGLNSEDLAELGKEDKPVLLKKDVIERNLEKHTEVLREDYNRIIGQALYNSDDRFGGKEHHNPDYMNFVKYGETKGALTLIELADRKENYEIVHIFEPYNKHIRKMKNK